MVGNAAMLQGKTIVQERMMKRFVLMMLLCGAAIAQAQTASREGVSDLKTDCSAGTEGNACQLIGAKIFAPLRPNGQGHRALVRYDFQTFGPSINFGNAGAWTISKVIDAPHVIFGTSGIDQFESASIVKNGTGDLAGLYFYVYGGGRAAQSDEGVTGLTVNTGEIGGYFHGTISGGAGRGSTALSLSGSAGAQWNWGYTCNGCMLLDISKGTIAGSLHGASIPLPGTYLNQLPTVGVAGGLPISQAWCKTLAAIPATDTAGAGTSRKVSCTLGAIGGRTPPFKAGGVVTIAGQWYPEQAMLTTVGAATGGVQELTLLARNPNPAGSVIFQGGIAGQSLSFDANLAATGFRTSYYVFGSVDGVNLIYGSQIAGDVRGHVLPRQGSEAETTSSGFHLYPSAEVVANTAQPSAPVLEPNKVDWAAGDMVENPRFQSFGGTGIRDICQEYTPTDEWGYGTCLMVQAAGPGVSGTYHPFRIANYNKLSSYLAGGGVLDPVPILFAEGPFGDLLQMPGPSRSSRGYDAVIDIVKTAAGDDTPFNLFALPSGKHQGAVTMTYDPGTKLIGFPNGVSVQSMATGANCSSATSPARCGSAAAGSVVIPAGADHVDVMTYVVTANSQILITPDTSLDGKLGVTCNKDLAAAFAPSGVTARVAGRSFTLTIDRKTDQTNCYSYSIVN